MQVSTSTDKYSIGDTYSQFETSETEMGRIAQDLHSIAGTEDGISVQSVRAMVKAKPGCLPGPSSEPSMPEFFSMHESLKDTQVYTVPGNLDSNTELIPRRAENVVHSRHHSVFMPNIDSRRNSAIAGGEGSDSDENDRMHESAFELLGDSEAYANSDRNPDDNGQDRTFTGTGTDSTISDLRVAANCSPISVPSETEIDSYVHVLTPRQLRRQILSSIGPRADDDAEDGNDARDTVQYMTV